MTPAEEEAMARWLDHVDRGSLLAAPTTADLDEIGLDPDDLDHAALQGAASAR